MSTPHAADGESDFFLVNVTPDFCRVGSQVTPFDIYQFLDPEKLNYASKVRARGKKMLGTGSVTAGVKGNQGQGVFSTVSLARGHSMVVSGSGTVRVAGRQLARSGDLCVMNVKI